MNYKNNYMFQKFITFAIIGVFNAVLDTTIWKLLSKFFSTSQASLAILKTVKLNQYSGAQLFSFMVGLTSSFYLNSTFTWKSNTLESQTKFIMYIVVSVTAWFATVLFINFFTKDFFINKYNKIITKIEDNIHLTPFLKKLIEYPLLVKLASISLSMIINFFGYNYLVFR